VVFFCQFTERNTAISTMLALGFSEHIVRKISGYAANSKEFFRYVKMAQNVIDIEAEKVFEKIMNYGDEPNTSISGLS
jgi:hypothetical protein